MKRIAVIGSGISGVSMAQLLIQTKKYIVDVYEKKNAAGGLIRCTNEEGVLFHRVGGHVFNSKNPKVLEWFFSFFDKELDFVSSERNAAVWMNNKHYAYPLENNIYSLDRQIIRNIVEELLQRNNGANETVDNFEAFLIKNFGKSLYELYFKPYNEKIWRVKLDSIPLPWLAGKLPMPNKSEIFFSNIARVEEKQMVHSKFYYPKTGGSSFIIDKLKEKLNIQYNSDVSVISKAEQKWNISEQVYDSIIYTGDIRKLHLVLKNVNGKIIEQAKRLSSLRANGTTTVLCATDSTPYSWVYLPETFTQSHRIIYTGNFSLNNNGRHKLTCTVEFSGHINIEQVEKELAMLPGNMDILAYNYEEASYVIQDFNTREEIANMKTALEGENFYLLGRFAEWEYYNMDKAIEAAMSLVADRFN